MERNFNEWLNEFRESISNYKYYVDFSIVHQNVDEIKIELNILNSLIGSKNIKKDFKNIIKKYPETLKCIPILLSVRDSKIYCQDKLGSFNYDFKKNLSNDDELLNKYCYFMEQTGLFDLLQNHIINNLIDYVTGVETGLNSNGRKNRGGDLMEDLVENFIIKSGHVKNQTYFKEMSISEISKRWKKDLSNIFNKDRAEKRFDFVIKTENMIYAIETNFYRTGGSKLNETARSYKNLSIETNKIDGFTFVWLTDGIGWKSARNNLKETFDVMEHIYNIQDLEQNIIRKVMV